MGQLCQREITKYDLKAVAMVSDPFDKYAILKIPEKEYNYGMLENLLKTIHNPFQKFSVDVRQEKKTEYSRIGRNDLCPCGSGKKYKKCHLGSPDELIDHYVVILNDKIQPAFTGEKYFNTWLE